MDVLLLAMFSLSNIACFLIGARVGQKVVKGEEVKLPTINPMEVIREQQERKEQQRVQDKVEAIMRNIDNYDGTAYGQEDVPR